MNSVPVHTTDGVLRGESGDSGNVCHEPSDGVVVSVGFTSPPRSAEDDQAGDHAQEHQHRGGHPPAPPRRVPGIVDHRCEQRVERRRRRRCDGVGVVAQRDDQFVFQVDHDSASLSSARARCNVDFTVPSGKPVMAAISASVRPE